MTTTPNRLAREIAEMADAQRRLGIMDEATHEKITARVNNPPPAGPTASDETSGPAGGYRRACIPSASANRRL